MAEPLWTSEQIAAATHGKLAGRPFTATGVSIDTRTLEAGDLFVALGGAFYAMKYVWKKPPVLTAVLPGKTEPGQTVSLSGKQFASDAAANVVRFGDYTGQVSSASPSATASAWRGPPARPSASSAISVTCGPPITTGTPAARTASAMRYALAIILVMAPMPTNPIFCSRT